MQRKWRLNINPDAEDLLNFTAHSDQAHKRSFAWNRVDQYINIAVGCVIAMQHRAKYARVARLVTLDCMPYGFTMQM